MNSGTTAMLAQSQMAPNAIYLPVQMPNEKATTSQIGASQLDLNQQQAVYHHQQHQHPTASTNNSAASDKNSADKILNANLLDLNTNTQLMQLLGVKQQAK